MGLFNFNRSFEDLQWRRSRSHENPRPQVPRTPVYQLLICSSICLLLGFAIGTHWGSREDLPYGKVATKFELQEIFTEAPSPLTDAAWAALVPKGRGFITVDSSQRPTIFAGNVPDLSQVRAVAVFHQIHCLNELRIGYYSNHTIPPDDMHSESPRYLFARQHRHSATHMMHCFDYLRQSLLCNSDTTLEGLREDGTEKSPGVDGWGSVHQCRDYSAVSSWAQLHRATADESGIQ